MSILSRQSSNNFFGLLSNGVLEKGGAGPTCPSEARVGLADRAVEGEARSESPSNVLKGVVVPIVTPLKGENQDKIDEAALEKLCDFLISKGVHGLFPGGTTGEGFLLSKETRKELASLVIESCGIMSSEKKHNTP